MLVAELAGAYSPRNFTEPRCDRGAEPDQTYAFRNLSSLTYKSHYVATIPIYGYTFMWSSIRQASCLALVIMFLALGMTSNAIAAGQKGIALVIGQSDYKSRPLPNPERDARDIGLLLDRLFG